MGVRRPIRWRWWHIKPRKTGPYEYAPIVRRPRLLWPNKARVALWVIPNLESFALDEPMPAGTGKIPDVPAYAMRDYGARVGVWRLIEVLSHYGIRGTVALNSEVCDTYPAIIEETRKLKWEYMGHNESNIRRLNMVPSQDEARLIHDSLARIETATGRRPVGWLSSGLQETWETLDCLAAEGCRYVADWVNDDQPYLMDINGKPLVSLPYSFEINDKPAFEDHHQTPEEFTAMIRRQFDVLYDEGRRSGRVMAIALHPYVIGVPHRIAALKDALKYVCSHKNVWLATGEEIVDYFLEECV
jgi:allantoinase